MTFAERLRELRLARGQSLRELAVKLHMDPAYVSRVETGKSPPSEMLIVAAARALGGDVEELMLLAGRVPSAWQGIISHSAEAASRSLRGAILLCARDTPAHYGHSPPLARDDEPPTVALAFRVGASVGARLDGLVRRIPGATRNQVAGTAVRIGLDLLEDRIAQVPSTTQPNTPTNTPTNNPINNPTKNPQKPRSPKTPKKRVKRAPPEGR